GDFDSGSPPGSNWAQYERVNGGDPARGCLEILRFYRGKSLALLRARVAEFWRSRERRWKAPVVATFRWLAQRGPAVFVVSRTPPVVLEPLVQHLPLRRENLFALELALDRDGRCTGEPAGTVTAGPGKAARLSAAGVGPLRVAAGNSILDLE